MVEGLDKILVFSYNINMKKFILTILIVSAISLFTSTTNAQMMGEFSNSSADWNEVVEHTLHEEKEGKELWDKFQAKEVVCANLNDEQFGVLGEYFMGQMMGDSHAAMNAMMIQAHGKEGEERIHVTLGKRLSSCDTSASVSELGGWMTMINMSSPFNSNQSNNSMMNLGFTPFGEFGWIFMLVFWGFIIWAIIVLIRGGFRKWHMRGHETEKSPLDILKERYAKGEIDKKEFEEKGKDLT